MLHAKFHLACTVHPRAYFKRRNAVVLMLNHCVGETVSPQELSASYDFYISEADNDINQYFDHDGR